MHDRETGFLLPHCKLLCIVEVNIKAETSVILFKPVLKENMCHLVTLL